MKLSRLTVFLDVSSFPAQLSCVVGLKITSKSFSSLPFYESVNGEAMEKSIRVERLFNTGII